MEKKKILICDHATSGGFTGSFIGELPVGTGIKIETDGELIQEVCRVLVAEATVEALRKLVAEFDYTKVGEALVGMKMIVDFEEAVERLRKSDDAVYPDSTL
jgi:hypothetical protein